VDPEGAARDFTAALAAALERALEDAAAAAGEVPRRGRGSGRSGVPLAALGAAGRALHAPATLLVEAAARRWTARPQRVAFGRIVFGLVLVPAWYATIAVPMLALDAGAWLLALIALPFLGACACLDLDRRRAAAREARGNTP
jgi:hypothetical protein